MRPTLILLLLSNFCLAQDSTRVFAPRYSSAFGFGMDIDVIQEDSTINGLVYEVYQVNYTNDSATKVINFLMTDSIIYYYEPLVKKRLPFIPVRKPLSLDTFFVDLNGKEVIKMKYSGYHKKKSIFDSVYYSVFSIESIKDGYPLKLYANRKFGIIAAYYNGSIAWWIE